MSGRGAPKGDGPRETAAGLEREPNVTPGNEEPGPDPQTPEDLVDASRPPDTLSTRAKAENHGKVTAENWNQ